MSRDNPNTGLALVHKIFKHHKIPEDLRSILTDAAIWQDRSGNTYIDLHADATNEESIHRLSDYLTIGDGAATFHAKYPEYTEVEDKATGEWVSTQAATPHGSANMTLQVDTDAVADTITALTEEARRANEQTLERAFDGLRQSAPKR